MFIEDIVVCMSVFNVVTLVLIESIPDVSTESEPVSANSKPSSPLASTNLSFNVDAEPATPPKATELFMIVSMLPDTDETALTTFSELSKTVVNFA